MTTTIFIWLSIISFVIAFVAVVYVIDFIMTIIRNNKQPNSLKPKYKKNDEINYYQPDSNNISKGIVRRIVLITTISPKVKNKEKIHYIIEGRPDYYISEEDIVTNYV